MIGTGPTGPGAIGLPADQTVFTPRQPHRLAVDGQVDIAHRRALLDLAGPTAARAGPLDDGLLDNQLDIAADAPIGQHTDVFEPDQGLDDLDRLTTNEGALEFDGHASKGWGTFVPYDHTARRPQKRGTPRWNPKSRISLDFSRRWGSAVLNPERR